MADIELAFHVLGPVAVERDGEPVPLGGPRQRVVLAYLALNAGRVVPAGRLLDEIWGEAAPVTGTGPLRTYVSQLRHLLAPGGGGAARAGPVVRRPPGYLLDVAAEQVDAHRFERHLAEARAAAAGGEPAAALQAADRALALWRGPALAGVADHPALRGEATRLDQMRVVAAELRAESLIATGQHAQAAAELGPLARADPLREHAWALLMTALYRSGRQGDALRCYQQARSHLVDQLGIEPGAELRELERAILRQDPALDPRPTPPPSPAAPRAPAAVHDLPRQLTSFVGRVAERARVATALAESPLVTLCGAGGSGKTRLAVVAAGELVDRFPDGVRFVDLSAVCAPDLVPQAVGAALGIALDPAGRLDAPCRAVGDRRVLLVLDNCEHVLDGAAEAVDELLTRCPRLRILATSREGLGLGAELVLRVGALGLPEVGPTDPHLLEARAEILRSEAVQLFLDRARRAVAGFAPTGPALDLVAGICRRLDGIPLAIELAAALVGSLPLAEIDARLDDRFALLQGARRRVPPRQRTLRATLDWSFDLLDPPDRELFVRLGVFVGDFTLAAAEAVAAPLTPAATVRSLDRLVRASMVATVSTCDGTQRYRLTETVRLYARELLDRHEAGDDARRRYARHYAAFAVEAERHVHGPAAPEWLGRVAAELPNLRAALGWAFSGGDLDTGLRLAGALRWFFARMGLLDDLDRWLDAGLRRPGLAPDLQVQALTAATFLAFMRGDVGRTLRLGDSGVAATRRAGDDGQLATALIARGGAAVYEGDLGRAEQCFDEAERLCHRLGDRWGRAWVLTGRAVASRRAGEPGRARGEAHRALEIFRQLGDGHGQVLPLVNVALAAQEEGRLGEALVAARGASGLAAELGDGQLQHTATCVLGRIELDRGQPARARDLLLRSIRDFPAAHHHHVVAVALDGLAALATEAGDHAAAAALLAYTAAGRDRRRLWLSDVRRRRLDALVAQALDALGPDRLRAEQERGRQLGLDGAVALAEAATAQPDPQMRTLVPSNSGTVIENVSP